MIFFNLKSLGASFVYITMYSSIMPSCFVLIEKNMITNIARYSYCSKNFYSIQTQQDTPFVRKIPLTFELDGVKVFFNIFETFI